MDAALKLFQAVPLGAEREAAPGIRFRYREAGHLLGAASAEVTVDEGGKQTRVVFSGDVGRYDAVLAKDPAPAPEADYLVVEYNLR